VYARSTTIQAQTSSIDAGTAHMRDEVMPTVMGIDGCVGLSLLVDRHSGRCIATSAWRSLETMHASEGQVRSIRDRAAEMFGGSSRVEEWEIALLHRAHRSADGACVRVVWVQMDPAQMDRAIDIYKMSALPEMEHIDGFGSASLLVDRTSGRAVVSVTYDSMDVMRANREQAQGVRTRGTQQAGARVLEVCEFELALAHLRVPELA